MQYTRAMEKNIDACEMRVLGRHFREEHNLMRKIDTLARLGYDRKIREIA